MPIRIGLLTPSSNTVLEPAAAAILCDLPGATAHFARFRVVSIGLDAAAAAQFDAAPILDAAALLADAKVDAICWSGASGAWLGAAADQALCEAITARTGIPATTATLALLAAFRALGVRRYGLVTPYLAAVQQAVVTRLRAEQGLDCVAERHLEDPGNFTFAAHDEATIAAMARAVAAARPGAIAIHCTNFRGTALAPALERETGIPVLDSIAVSLWGVLLAAGADPAPLAARWGRVFSIPSQETKSDMGSKG